LKVHGIDSQGNPINLDSVVRIWQGPHKGKRGVIKHIYKNILFLWDKEFVRSNGIFVDKTGNVVIKGEEYLKQGGKIVGSMNRHTRDQIEGKMVIIIAGEFKGYKGRVKQVDDKQALIEIPSRGKTVPVARQDIREESENQGGGEGGMTDYRAGGNSVYEGGKTPNVMATPNAYYPHSPHWGAQANGGTECKPFLSW